LDLDAPVPVFNSFPSAVPGTTFRNSIAMDSDLQPWRRLGGEATLRWLANRMIPNRQTSPRTCAWAMSDWPQSTKFGGWQARPALPPIV
jgi:hypothetical protein